MSFWSRQEFIKRKTESRKHDEAKQHFARWTKASVV